MDTSGEVTIPNTTTKRKWDDDADDQEGQVIDWGEDDDELERDQKLQDNNDILAQDIPLPTPIVKTPAAPAVVDQPVKKNKVGRPRLNPEPDESTPTTLTQTLSEYELEREQRIAQNRALLLSLGVLQPDKVSSTPTDDSSKKDRKKYTKKTFDGEARTSRRLKGEIPEQQGHLTIWEIGEIVKDDKKREFYWSQKHARYKHQYPVGFKATKNQFGKDWTMLIEEGPEGPIFHVQPNDGPEFVGATPTGPWTDACIALFGNTAKTRVSGPHQFGFTDPFIQMIVLGLPNHPETDPAILQHVGRAARQGMKFGERRRGRPKNSFPERSWNLSKLDRVILATGEGRAQVIRPGRSGVGPYVPTGRPSGNTGCVCGDDWSVTEQNNAGDDVAKVDDKVGGDVGQQRESQTTNQDGAVRVVNGRSLRAKPPPPPAQTVEEPPASSPTKKKSTTSATPAASTKSIKLKVPTKPPPPKIAQATSSVKLKLKLPPPAPASTSKSKSKSKSTPSSATKVKPQQQVEEQQQEEEIMNCVCEFPDVDDGSLMVSCDKCFVWFHAECVDYHGGGDGVGGVEINEGKVWKCPRCRHAKRRR
ncbi:hypothetical protein HDU76_002294 [Blyttiomyces sp. JEL0837]|nr:hypothetical protein HDU76_002294 [Blyttiomyces sp. JEL0837]